MFLRFKSVLSGRQVLHKSLMSSCDVRLLHGRHSIGHNVPTLQDACGNRSRVLSAERNYELKM